MDVVKPLTYERLCDCLQDALNSWHDDATLKRCLGDLRLIKRYEEEIDLLVDEAHVIRHLVLDNLQALAKYAHEEAYAIGRRYFERDTLQAIAAELQSSVATAKRRSENSVQHLARIIYNREKTCREQELRQMMAALPPKSYDLVFGQEKVIEEVVQQLLSPSSPWVLALVGLGGVGKSALADAIVRRALTAFKFEGAIWVRHEGYPPQNRPLTLPEIISRLQSQLVEWVVHQEPRDQKSAAVSPQQAWEVLKNRRLIVVIDNLDTQEDTPTVMEFLRQTAEPTKFLVTSRSRLLLNSGIYHYPIDELNYESAHRLLHDFSSKLGPRQPAISREVSSQIYDRVGGHPLTLKLVANLLEPWPLSQILNDIASPEGKTAQEIYRPIFSSLWETLSPGGQAVLGALGRLPPEGATASAIAAAADLPPPSFWGAVAELTNRSLLESRGGLTERRYGVQRVTYCFLQTGLKRA